MALFILRRYRIVFTEASCQVGLPKDVLVLAGQHTERAVEGEARTHQVSVVDSDGSRRFP